MTSSKSIDEQFGEGYAKANPGLIGALVTAGMAQDSEREHHAALNEIADVAKLIGGELRHLGSLEGGLNYIAEAIDGVRKELRSGINIMVKGTGPERRSRKQSIRAESVTNAILRLTMRRLSKPPKEGRVMANVEREETDEEFLARLAARRAKKKAEKLAAEEAAKPRLVLPVSQETAERVRARPESVRISTVREDAIPWWNGFGCERSCKC